MKIIWIDANQTVLLSQVKSLADDLLGENYFSQPGLIDILQKPQNRLIGCISDDRLVGFALASTKTRQEMKTVFANFGIDTKHDETTPIGCFHAAGVANNWQKKGIALELGQQHLRWLAEEGCKTVYAISWDHPGKTSKPTLEKLGFEVKVYSQSYFRKLSSDCVCPVCASTCCTCGAYLMVRNHSEQHTF